MESELMGFLLPILVACYDQIGWSSSGPKGVRFGETGVRWYRSHQRGRDCPSD